MHTYFYFETQPPDDLYFSNMKIFSYMYIGRCIFYHKKKYIKRFKQTLP